MDAYPLKGGLDLRTGKTQVNPGTLQDCLNYEVAEIDGYSRISGFQRFDGQFRVAECVALRLNGTLVGAFQPGDAVTFGAATVIVTLVEGSAIDVLMHNRNSVPGLPATATNTSRSGSVSVTQADWLAQAAGLQSDVSAARKTLADSARALVGVVPGDPNMPAAGAFWFKNRLYAVRDFPLVWFASPDSFPFHVGDQVTLPGGTFRIIAITYSSGAYLAGHMTLWPLGSGGEPMTVAPSVGDAITHTVTGDGFLLGGVVLGGAPLATLVEFPSSQSSATVTAAAVTPASGDEPVMRQAQTMAGLWKATGDGWVPVDLKHEAQFTGGGATLQTFLADNVGFGASPTTSAALFGGAATFNGVDCLAAVDAADGTDVALSGNTSDELYVTGFNFSAIPTTAQILGVQVAIKRHADVGHKAADSIVQLVGLDGPSVNKALAPAWDTADTVVTYGSVSDLWGNDNLTPAVVRSSAFGVRLVTNGVDASPSGGIDYVTMTVTYRRLDAAVFAWDGTADVPVSLVNAQLLTGSWAGGDGAGYLALDFNDAVWTSHAANGMELRSAASGGGDLLCTLASADVPVSLPGWADLAANQSRYQFLATNFYGMAGDKAIYGVSGASPAFTFDGERFLFIRTPLSAALDLPRHIAQQGAALVLGYWEGAYILSVNGDPMDFLGADGAVSIEIGEYLTGLLAALGDALLVTSRTRTLVLHGLDSTTYQQDVVSGNRGAIEFTAADVGRLLVTDPLGIAAADATQAFGDFARTYLSQAVETWLAGRLRAAPGFAQANLKLICALALRSKNQYRLYFQDGYVLTLTANEPVEFTLQRYFAPGTPGSPFPVAAVCTGIDEQNRERVFGSFDAVGMRGYLYELDQGDSFDGQPLPAHVTLNPLSFSATAQGGLNAMTLKRFDRMFVLGQAEGSAALTLSRTIDNTAPDGSNGFPFTFGPPAAAAGVRAVRGIVEAPVEGYEIAVRIDANSDADGPHTLQTIATTADQRGDSRGQPRE